MKIRAITVEAFRGFGERVRFDLQDVQVLLLYGPNGHGKTSIFDAIEWALTGEIHRYSLSTDERGRTRFVRNLHARPEQTSFVSLDLLLSTPHLPVKVTRTCTAQSGDRTDYGKDYHCLEIVMPDPNGDGEITVSDQAAEDLLREWLIAEPWRDKIKETFRSVSLTHMLGQEKLNQFLRVMKDDERYDALSLLFGTEHFEKYKEMFRRLLKDLELDLERKAVEVGAADLHLRKMGQDIAALEAKVAQEGKVALGEVLAQYGEHFEGVQELYDKGAWEELQTAVQTTQAKLRSERFQLENATHRLDAARESFPQWQAGQVVIQNTTQTIHTLTELLGYTKKLSQVKGLIERLPQYEAGKNKRDSLESQINNSTTVEAQLAALSSQEQGFVSRVHDILKRIQQNGEFASFAELSALALQDDETKHKVIQGLDEIKNAHIAIETLNQVQKASTQLLADLEKSIVELQGLDEKYQSLLGILHDFVAAQPEANECPACGTPDISSDFLKQRVESEQGKMHPELPALGQRVTDTKEQIKKQTEQLAASQAQFFQAIEGIKQILALLERQSNSNREAVLREQRQQQGLRKELEALDSFMQEYQQDAHKLGLDATSSVFNGDLAFADQELENHLQALSVEDRINLTERIQGLEANRKKAQEESRDFTRKLEALGAPEEVVTNWSETQISGFLDNTLHQHQQSLTALEQKEQAVIKTLTALDQAKDEKQLAEDRSKWQTQKEVLSKLQGAATKLKADRQVLQDAMVKVPTAMDNLNAKMIDELFDTIQKIFARINSHPLYRKLHFSKDHRHRAYRLLIYVLTGQIDEENRANPSYIFSSAQVNSIALSFFLAMAVHQRWSPLRVIAMDDPIQSMDEVNVLALIDLLRVFIDTYDKQVIISTHDYSFYQMMLRKFRFQHVGVIEYEGYSQSGPIIKEFKDDLELLTLPDQQPQYVQVHPGQNKMELEEVLLSLDQKL